MIRVSVDKALELISSGKSLESYEVVVDEPLDAVKAFHLRKNGISVPDELISYEDDNLAYDEDFDEDEWTKLPQKMDEYMFELAEQSPKSDNPKTA